MLKNIARFGLLSIAISVLTTGCIMPPTPIPASYFNQNHEMSVKVTRCPPAPQMMDSGQGGIIGALVNATRASGMTKNMEGIKGETVSELLRQKVTGKMEDCFDVVDDQEQLAAEIAVTQWGWFVPSTAFGIKTGSYQLRINGDVTIYDKTQKRRKKIAYAPVFAQEPLGNDPAPDVAQEALLKAIDSFAGNSSAILLRTKP